LSSVINFGIGQNWIQNWILGKRLQIQDYQGFSRFDMENENF